VNVSPPARERGDVPVKPVDVVVLSIVSASHGQVHARIEGEVQMEPVQEALPAVSHDMLAIGVYRTSVQLFMKTDVM